MAMLPVARPGALVSRRSIASTLCLLALTACGGLTACGAGAPAGPPSLILVSIDTLRADRLGAYGNKDGLTPNLDAFAGEATLFEHAYSQATQTAPSHGSMFTSRYPAEQTSTGRQTSFGPDNPLLAQVLGVYGYQTGGFVGGADLAPEMGMSAGFDVYTSAHNFGSLYHTAPYALQWIDARDKARPFFAFIHGYDTHSRYLKPPPYGYAHADASQTGVGQDAVRTATERIIDGRMYSDFSALMSSFESILRPRSPSGRKQMLVMALPSREPPPELNEADIALVRGVYDGAVTYADTMFGLLMASLQERGLLDEVVIVVMSDHGEQLGEEGLFGHCCGVADEEDHVPLMVRLPGGEGGGRRISGLVELIDVMPTLVQLAGARPPAGIQGASLVPALNGEPWPGRAAAFTESNETVRMVSARGPKGRLTYTGLAATQALLPDVIEASRLEGPGFTATEGADPAASAELRDGLVGWLRALKPIAQAEAPELSPDLKQSLREHGYWEVKP